MRRRSVVSLAVFAVVALVLGGAALAWACGAQAGIKNSPNTGMSGNPQTGKGGTTFTVSGTNFREGPVEVHWNSVSGPLLGTATGPSFSISVTVPAGQAEGTYYVVAFQENVGSPSDPFTVTGVAQASSSSSSSSGGDSAGTGGKTSSKASGADGKSSPSPSRSNEGSKSPSTSTSPSTGAAPVVTTATGTDVFAPSVAPATTGRRADKAKDAPRGKAEAPKADERATSAERYFDGLESPAVLPSPFDSSVASAPSTPWLSIGAGLLGAGLVAMFMGVLVAEVRRRRAAEAGSRRLK